MGYGSCQGYMSQPLTSYGGLGHFNSAAVADHSLESDLFIFSAVTFPVLGRPEDTLTEQTILLRLEGPVVYRLRLLDLAVGPLEDLLG